jgi:hypothetical protein
MKDYAYLFNKKPAEKKESIIESIFTGILIVVLLCVLNVIFLLCK